MEEKNGIEGKKAIPTTMKKKELFRGWCKKKKKEEEGEEEGEDWEKRKSRNSKDRFKKEVRAVNDLSNNSLKLHLNSFFPLLLYSHQ